MGERTITFGVEVEPELRRRLMAMLEEHRETIVAQAYAAGIAEERARVVAWLRGVVADEDSADPHVSLVLLIAHRIEAGAHMPETGGEG